jgi:hypothetical protein
MIAEVSTAPYDPAHKRPSSLSSNAKMMGKDHLQRKRNLGMIQFTYPLVNIYIAVENHHF